MSDRWTAAIPAVALGLATLVPSLAATAPAAAAACAGKEATLTEDDALHDEDDTLDGGAGTNRAHFSRLQTGVQSSLGKGRSTWGTNVVTTRRRDRITGGSGQDRAVGGSGRDRCSAERTISC